MGTVFEAKNIACSFADEAVLSDVTFSVFTGDRIGIIGSNGCGKTTLLNILAGTCDDLNVEGSLNVSCGTLGYLSQKTGEDSRDIPLYEDFLSVFSPLLRMEEEISSLEKKLADNPPDARKISDRLAALYEQYGAKGGLTFRSRLKSTLQGLKFTEDMYGIPVKNLSGGQKIRLALGKLLLEDRDTLLLDEPTNHLDEESIVFLEDTLKNYRGTVLVVSHDRYFLDTVTRKTLLIDHGVGTLYNAPYSKYQVLREADLEYRRRLYAQQQKEIAHIRDVIKTQREWSMEHNFITAEHWQKKLDRMDILDDPDAVRENAPAIRFGISQRGGNEVLSVSDASFGFSKDLLFENLSFELRHGERMFIRGANGGGKSTLLKLICGELRGNGGKIRLGANVTVSYYSQDFAELNLDNTPFDEIFEAANEEYYHGGGIPTFHGITEIRNALAAFGFTGDEVFKEIGKMSGGEKARLALLKLSYNKANLLILDEPTNHLDIKTCEVLEDALLSFPGTLLCVSHDRYFVNRVATRTLCLDNYAPKKAENPASPSASLSGKEAYLKNKEAQAARKKLERRVEALEKTVSGLEEELAACAAVLNDPAKASDFALLNETFDRQNRLKEELDLAETEYLEVLEQLEAGG